jgi:hypothetical protein
MACCSAVSGRLLAPGLVPTFGFWQAGKSKDSDSNAAAVLSAGLRRAKAITLIWIVSFLMIYDMLSLWRQQRHFTAKS